MNVHQQLIDAATAFLPELEARSAEIDKLRQLPQDLAENLAAQGFYRLCTPQKLNGLAQPPATMYRVCETLAAANGSAAWCVFIGSTSQYLLGALPPEQQEAMTRDVNVLTSGVFADSGTALFETRNDQPGYLINGHWRRGSGCHNAAWISGGIHEVDARGEPVSRQAGPVTFPRDHEPPGPAHRERSGCAPVQAQVAPTGWQDHPGFPTRWRTEPLRGLPSWSLP